MVRRKVHCLPEEYRQEINPVRQENEEDESYLVGWDGGYWQSQRRVFSGMMGTEVRFSLNYLRAHKGSGFFCLFVYFPGS